MPAVSEAQRRAMFAAKAGHSNLGIPQSVGEEFAAADPGGKFPARAKDLSPEKFSVIKKAMAFLSEFFGEEEQEPEHAAQDDALKGRAASLALITKDGKVLLVKRADDEENFPSHWALPGGKVEDGEEPDEAALREAAEEIGGSEFLWLQHLANLENGKAHDAASARDCLKTLDQRRTPHGWDHWTYALPVKDEFEPKLNTEHSAHAWVYPDELPEKTHPGVKATFDDLMASVSEKKLEKVKDVADPSGRLSNTTRSEIDSTKHREDMPESAFLLPESRKYPVKEERDGTWKYTRNLLLAAARRARLEGRSDLARRADAIREREFGKEAQDVEHEPDGTGWLRPVVNAGSKMPALIKNARITLEMLKKAPTYNTGANDEWSDAARATALAARKAHANSGSAEHHKAASEAHTSASNEHDQVAKSHSSAQHRVAHSAAAEAHKRAAFEHGHVASRGGREDPFNRGAANKLSNRAHKASQAIPRDAGTNDAALVDWSRFRPRSAPERARLAMDRALPELRLARGAGMAFDRASKRVYDSDGRLHVDDSIITAAQINDYLGEEIPEYKKLGLDPKRRYKLLRDPEELRKAVKTFNGLPILDRHQPATADDHPKDITIGATGNNATFDGKVLRNSLVIWPSYASKDIEDSSRQELSCGYAYDPDPSPGTWEGKPYDIVMRNIRGNHLTIVPEGRVKGAMVADEMPYLWTRKCP